MGHSAAIQDEAFDATTRSVGCAAALLPRLSLKVIARWSRKEEKAAAIKKGKRNSASRARVAPCGGRTLAELLYPRSIADSGSGKTNSFSIEICSSAASQNGEEVQSSTLSNDETWAVMRRRFTDAHKEEKAAAEQKARESRRARSEQENWIWGPPPWQM
jgi:hypothetical protein